MKNEAIVLDDNTVVVHIVKNNSLLKYFGKPDPRYLGYETLWMFHPKSSYKPKCKNCIPYNKDWQWGRFNPSVQNFSL